jgi:D-glycero-alpha-D-manno-heptose-7-phosphate kinase
MKVTEVCATAPTRIDLAGGTLDLWPICLLEEGARTVNVAVDLEATARIVPRGDSILRIQSRDQSAEESYPRLEALRFDGPLRFMARLVASLPPPTGIDLVTDCAAPAGSGLGGSSALGIAAGAALARYRGEELTAERLLGLVQAVETQVLRVPTGVQDYYPALLGGALAIHYSVRGTRAEPIPLDFQRLEDRLVLCFSGVSRSSGVSNWDMLKRYLDGDPSAVEGIRRVAAATRRMEAALANSDVDGAAAALKDEWEARTTLSAKVSSREIETLMRAAGSAGSIAGKVCGAGGGGCIVFLTLPGRRDEVSRVLERQGGRVLPVRLQREGLRVDLRSNGH